MAAWDKDRLVHRPVDGNDYSIDREIGHVRGAGAGGAVQARPSFYLCGIGSYGDSGNDEFERREIGIGDYLVHIADHPRAWNLRTDHRGADRVSFTVQR